MAYGTVNVPGVSWKDLNDALDGLMNTINFVPSQGGTLTYTGSEQEPMWNGYDPDALEIGGTVKAVDAGIYSVAFTPKKGYRWADGTTKAKSVNWTIGRASMALPIQNGALTYTGSSQSPTWTGYDEQKMMLQGVVSGINAGEYNAVFCPKDNYLFENGITGTVTVPWIINKAEGSIVLDKSSLSLGIGITTGTVAVTRPGDGVISAESDHTDVATVCVDGGTIIITAVGGGTAVITVRCAAGTNYKEASDQTINVTVEAASAILADNTPAVIQAMARSGQAANLWSVGDKIPIEIKGTVGALELDGTYYAFILGFDHNSSIEGSNSIHFQVGKDADGTDIAFVDKGYTDNGGSTAGFRMNTSKSSSGGWKNSYMRNNICTAFLSVLPNEWRAIIMSCTKYSDNAGGSNYSSESVTATQDKIWLPAEYEVFGRRYYAHENEQNYQEQYCYYKNGNSPVKYRHNRVDATVDWWNRSVDVSQEDSFRVVRYSGISSDDCSWRSLGFAPCFMVS